ncbi:tetratricopeptide repeat protein [Pseudanabaena sp. PCC 6802]|uniref:tetratricopeptide repeat protein n=1 Tax=Pseudanabaena sp. PCC 6802 TaxID=118173 RepID=UPI00034CA97B|nr:tetratricopeptide repeat protein [Pseudanabaena sp. PCC 6802]
MKAKGTQIDLVKESLVSGNYTQALMLCQQILAERPNWAIAYQYMGEALSAQGKVEDAIDAYGRAIAIQPDLAEAHAYLADLYSQIECLPEAIAHYQLALKVRPDWAALHHNLGNALYKQQELGKAVNSYQRAIAIAPNYTKAIYNLGVVLEQQGRLDAAIVAYERVIDLQPEHLNARSNLGCLLIQQAKFQEAVRVFHDALALSAGWATLHNNLGRALLGLKQIGAAIAAFSRAIQLQPDMAIARQNLGQAWQLAGYHDQAVASFQSAIALDPDCKEAYARCAASAIAMQKLDLAFSYLQAGLHVSDADREFVLSYCRSNDLSDRADEMDCARAACARFLEILQQNPQSDQLVARHQMYRQLGAIYRHFGNIYFDSGDPGGAESYYRQALQIYPDTFQLYEKLGDCLVKQKRLDDGAIAYQMALSRSNSPTLLYKLGWTLEQLQQFEQAIACYESVWQMDSTNIDGWEQDIDAESQDIKGIYLDVTHWLEGRSPLSPPADMTPIPPRKVCGGLNCHSCLREVCQWFAPWHLGNGIYRCAEQKLHPYAVPNRVPYVEQIPRGKAWSVPHKSYWQVCNAIATLTADNYLLADLSRDYPGQLPICQGYDPSQHLIFWQTALPPLEFISGKVAVLSGLSGNVYFHWMVDILPRLEILRRCGVDWAEIDWFVVNSCSSAFQSQTLEILGVPAPKIIESDRQPYIQAEQLIVPSFAGYLGWLSDWALEFLRQAFIPPALALADRHYPERIYVSRERAKFRKIFNEAEVMQVLSQHGFVSVVLESMSFLEQVAMFARAKAIVAPHGSGLTNIAFCHAGTQIVEIFSPHYVRQYFWTISQQLQLQHYYLLGKEFNSYPLLQLMYPSPLTEDILVNLNELHKIMELIE